VKLAVLLLWLQLIYATWCNSCDLLLVLPMVFGPQSASSQSRRVLSVRETKENKFLAMLFACRIVLCDRSDRFETRFVAWLAPRLQLPCTTKFKSCNLVLVDESCNKEQRTDAIDMHARCRVMCCRKLLHYIFTCVQLSTIKIKIL
jgi:hypothetical protein